MIISIVEFFFLVLINIVFFLVFGFNDKEFFEICLRILLIIIIKYKKVMKLKKKLEDLN